MELHRTNVKSVIDKLQARGDLFTRQLIKEKKRTNELQVKLKEVNERIETIRESNKQKAICLLNKYSTTPNEAYHRVDGVNPTSLAESNQKKIVKTLESRLGKALVRRNQLENENASIKDTIDKIRRKIANDIKNRGRMEKELIRIKADIDDVMERAAAAADEREKLIVKRNQILEENDEKQLIFEKEYSELSNYIVMQARSLEDSIAKATDNVASKLSLADTTLSKSHVASGTLNSSKEIKNLQGKLDRLENEYALATESLKEHERKINSFEKKFKELQEVSGLESVDDIISTFVRNEDECFSMFNYIQAVNQDCDRTIRQASKLKKEIAKLRSEQAQKEMARNETVRVNQQNLRDVQEEREKLYQTAIQARRTAETIARRVTALYFKLKCHELDQNDHSSSSRNSLPPANLRLDRKLTMISGEEVSERDIINLMESIERRAIQIINIYLKKEPSTTRRARRQNSMLVSYHFV
jgi:chromosome segregation ATPase